MSSHTQTYAAYKEKQRELAQMLEEASVSIATLAMDTAGTHLMEYAEKASSDSLKIMVVGTFKNGKSTFINSFLGQDVLPAYAMPCTAVINEVVYGDEKRAFLHFRKDLPDPLPTNIPSRALEQIKRFSGQEIPPIEIPSNELEAYTTIPMDKDPKEMLMESPYEKIVLHWPLDLLENGVEIIDSPGLNEHKTRTQVTEGYLDKADAILFVLTADKLCSEDEMRFVDLNLKKRGYGDIYFIINRFDTINSQKEKQGVRDWAKNKLCGFTSFGEDGLFFVSARNALDGKTQDKPDLYNGSGMPEFERELSDFLVNHRGKIKMSQPVKELRRILATEGMEQISLRRAMLESSLHELIARRDAAIPQLHKLKDKLDKTRQNISRQVDSAIPEIRYQINKYFADISTNIEVWVNEYEPATQIGLLTAKQNAEPLIHEITGYVKDRLEEEQVDWQQNTLGPFISDKVNAIFTSNEANLENFFLELDKIKLTIAGPAAAPSEGNASGIERLMAAGLGLFATGPAGAILGGVHGFSKDFLSGVLKQFALIGGLTLLGLLNPLTIIPIIGYALFKNVWGAGDKITATIKAKVVEALKDQVGNSAVDSIEETLDGLKKQIWGAFEPMLNNMDANVRETEAHVDQVIEEMTQGQQEIDRQKDILASTEERIAELISKADEFYSVNIEGR